ncbi:MAG: oligosaccharide flippase family protein [Elusimicrobiales bacterium]|nr:oligosaccharide flippase family protein [Elusimicrobiales bacterium]
MFKDIKVLGKETVIYGISTVFARLLNFILLPLYTYYLSPDIYGVVATVFSIIAFLNVIYGLGLNQGYMRFFKEKDSLSQTVSVVFFSSFILSFILILLSKPITYVFNLGISNHKLIIYSSLILYFDSLVLIPLTDLRMKHRAYSFVFIKIFSIVFNIILNVVFLKYFKMEAEGVFFANVISSFSQLFFLTGYFKYITLKFSKSLLKEIFSYSLPYIPSSISSVVIQLIDRPIMMLMLSSYAVGIYQANFRLSIFINLIISMFDFAWRPFVMERLDRTDAKEIFKKVFDYFVVITIGIWLFLSLFIEDIVKISIGNAYLINPNYWSGLSVVPIIMLAYFFNGLYVNFMIGSMITKKTHYTMLANLISAALSVSFNFILIPKFSIYGAAFSVLISYMFLAVFMYMVNKKIYPIDYNIKKNLFLVFGAVVCFVSAKFVNIINPCLYQQFKLFLILIFPLSIFAFGYFSKEEIQKLKNILLNR